MAETMRLPLRDLTRRIKPILPYLVVIALFAMGIFALYHLLRPVNLKDVVAQVRATPWHILVLSLCATLTGYAALIGYEWSALRYIRKSLPFRVVMTGGFLGYALGNTIGAGPVTGGAVRYRIYSALGLTGYDIAGIAIFGSVAFGLGASILGFGALTVHPWALQSVTALPPQIMRTIGIASLVIAAAVLIGLGLRRSEFRIRGHRFNAPSLGLMSGQLLFTAIDICMAASVLYLVLPPSDLGFATFLAVFCAAMFAGVASHVPGGVGVFETVIIAALPASVPLDQAAAGLLLYRMIYYLVPFALALALLALSELRMAGGKAKSVQIKAIEPVLTAVSAIVPLAMSAMVFASGVLMVLSSLVPASTELAEELEFMVPLAFVEGGALLSSAIGVALLAISHGLLRRIEGAYWLAVGALFAGLAASLMQGLDYERALVLGAILLVLAPCRREFFRSSRLTQDPFSLQWFLLVVSVGSAALAVYLFAHKATDFNAIVWWQFAVDQAAPRATRAGLVASVLGAALLLFMALRPARLAPRLAQPDDLIKAERIIAAQDNPDANFVFTGDKSILFSANGNAFLMYRVQGRSWIALGDPVGARAEAAQLVWAFYDAANAANCRAVFYEVTAAYLPLWAEMGLAIHKMGEEAVVDLAAFSLDGSDRKRLRTTYNRAGRDGLSFEMLSAPITDATLAQLRVISDQWLASKNAKEKQFSVGRFDASYLRRFPMAVVKLDGQIVAFANVLPTQNKTEATLDLMRHTDDAPSGLMEYLFIALILELKSAGYASFSLGMAPLSGLENRKGSRWTVKLGAMVYRHGGNFYNFEGLRGFKAKFAPDWQPRFLVASPRSNILVIAAEAAALISGSPQQEIGRANQTPDVDPLPPAP